MANREKGEIALDIGERQYTLALTLDAMVAVEDLFSTPAKEVTFQEVAQRAERGSIKALRALIWCMFREHHPEIKLDQISGIMKAAGGLDAVNAIAQAAVRASEPDPRDLKELDVKTGRPPQAQAIDPVGTGEDSTSKPAVSA
jgi:hypothetical protein